MEQTLYCEVIRAEWNDMKTVMMAIRQAVFIDEQKVPDELEWDGKDEEAMHFVAMNIDGEPIGTARLTQDGQISRLSVLQPFRGQGVGSEILRLVEQAARVADLEEIYLHAQTHAISFYENAGFVTNGGVFMDAGIPHRMMVKDLR